MNMQGIARAQDLMILTVSFAVYAVLVLANARPGLRECDGTILYGVRAYTYPIPRV